MALLAACGDSPETPEPGPDTGDDRNQAVVVNEDVRVLDASARADVDAFDLDTTRNEGELRFAASSAFARNVGVGAVVVAAPIDGVAPYGFLQRVESKEQADGQIVLGTAQATLEETFNKAEIRYEQELTPADLDSTETRTQGIELRHGGSHATRRQPLGFDFGIDFNQVLVDADGDESTTDDQLVLDGRFDFNASARADIDIDWFAEVGRFMFRVDVGESAEVEVSGNAGVDFDERITVANYNFGSFTITVGPVPVVFNVSMSIDVGAEGRFEANLHAKAVQDSSLTLGAEYSDADGWKNLNDFDSSFNFAPPEITAAGSARAWVQPQLDVKIYGLAGPFVFVQAYVAADAELHRSPFWRFDAGLDFGVGFEIELPVVGSVARFQRTYPAFEEELDTSPNAAPTVDVLAPEDGARPKDGDRLRFELDVADREQQFVDVVVTDDTGAVVVEERVDGASPVTLLGDGVCTGSHTYRITASDDDGATTTETVSIVAENRVPSVTLDRGSAPDPFPGGYLVAFADARDWTCESGNAAEPDLIGWYADGRRIGSTDQLLYRLPPGEYATGDEFQLRAHYDDGEAVGRSDPVDITVGDKQEGDDLPPTPIVRTPVDGERYDTVQGEFFYSGIGIDTEDGELNTLVWELEKGNQWIVVGQSKSGQFNMFDHFDGGAAFGAHRLRLTVTDGAGQSTSEIIAFEVYPEG